MLRKASQASRGFGRGGTQILTPVNDISVRKERKRKAEKRKGKKKKERKKKTPIRSILGLLEITLLISN